VKKLILLLFLTPIMSQTYAYNDSTYSQYLEMTKNRMVRDSVIYNRASERELYINNKTRDARRKKGEYRKWVIIGGVAIVSYYVGYSQGKYERRKGRYRKGNIGDKDYIGK